MTRRQVSFACEGSTLWGTIDDAPGTTGLLIVSGGNEIRCGPWGSQAWLAATLAAGGWPVFRFDRRGVGDSEGANAGFRSSGPDIVAAVAAFHREAPQVDRVVAFGNCDAASALLAGPGGAGALILGNPWTFDDEGQEASGQAVRTHYRRRLADPLALRRLLTGRVGLRQLIGSLASAVRPDRRSFQGLASDISDALRRSALPITVLIAERDGTGQSFLMRCGRAASQVRICPGATHSFVEPHAREWLLEEIKQLLRSYSTSTDATA